MKPLEPIFPPGKCIYTAIDTSFKHRGEWTSEHFLLAGGKLFMRFKDSEPDLTFDKAVDVIISAQSYRVIFGEKEMDVNSLKEKVTWSQKVKKLFGNR